MDNLKNRLNQFMQGRYGVDDFARGTLVFALALIIISTLMGSGSRLGWLLEMIGLLALVYNCYRVFSRNISQRYEENKAYLAKTASIRSWFNREKNIMKQRKDFHIYSCPGCGQKIRIPKGKGRIEISCPKCHTKFIKNS